MTARRILRILLALIVAAIFAGCTYVHLQVTPRTADIGAPGSTYDYTARQTPPGPLDKFVSFPADLPGVQQVTSTPAPVQTAAPAQEVETGRTDAEPEATPEPTPTPEPTVDPESPYGKALANAAARGLPAPPEIDPNSWEFTLVNGDHSIGQYEPEMLAYLNQTLSETDIQTEYNSNRCPVDVRISQPLVNFGLACKNAGLTVFLSSGYRSYYEQSVNFQRICQNNGISDGKDTAGHYITMPAGCSEHQLALCCDITDRYYEIKNSSIEQTETYHWLLEHCAEDGFIHRFPSGKEDVTGVMYEPWHFRYVGEEAARYMEDNGLVLEEFLQLYGVV